LLLLLKTYRFQDFSFLAAAENCGGQQWDYLFSDRFPGMDSFFSMLNGQRKCLVHEFITCGTRIVSGCITFENRSKKRDLQKRFGERSRASEFWTAQERIVSIQIG
jgi:hypothetical protein